MVNCYDFLFHYYTYPYEWMKKRQAAALADRAALLSNKEKYIILDTETTGLSIDSEIVELGIINIDGEILFDSLIKPFRYIPEDVTEIHGITNEMVAAAPTWPEVWPVVKIILADRTVIAYNAAFDAMMIVQSCQAWSISDIPSINTECLMENVMDY